MYGLSPERDPKTGNRGCFRGGEFDVWGTRDEGGVYFITSFELFKFFGILPELFI